MHFHLFTLRAQGAFLPYPAALCAQMAKDSHQDAHQQQRARSYANLDRARADTKWKNGYDWQQIRHDLT